MVKMIKYLAIPLILVGCTAPVTDPPAHACSPRLDGGFTFCPNPDEPFPDPKPIIKPKPIIPKEELRGEIDIYNPMHWHQMQTMFQRNITSVSKEKLVRIKIMAAQTVTWSIVIMIAILLISVSIVIYYITRYDHYFPND